MKFNAISAVLLLPLAALAAPAKKAVSMNADGAQWTIESMKRVCNGDDTSCEWSFGINRGDGSAATDCGFTVEGTPASRAPETGATCGDFTVTSGWSGQFGDDQGFTTLSVVDWAARLIAYPAYSDVDLADGVVVTPDRSFDVSKLS